MTFRPHGEQLANEREARLRRSAHRNALHLSQRRREPARIVAAPRPGSRRLLVATGCAVSVLVALSFAGDARAAGGGIELEQPRIDQGNEKSLQRGAKHFVNNCLGCHSADYARYSRVADDLGLSESEVEDNLIFTTDEQGEATKVGALISNNMTREYGEQAFGVSPPNLALTARSRGADWIYSFLKSFYLDPERTGTGVNNLVYPGTAMPHVLWSYQGWQTLAAHGEGEAADELHEAPALTLEQAGSQSPAEYDAMVADITNFLTYMADPIKQTRHRIGLIVMLFLFALLVVSYFLKKEYWKDVV